jgi:hypothetical protein
MSRKLDIGLKSVTISVGGKYDTHFWAPLIIKPCEHLLDKNKENLAMIFGIIVHGNSDGTSEVINTEKLEGSKIDFY